MRETLPLPDFHARYLFDDVVRVTNISKVVYDGKMLCANRSFNWNRTSEGCELRFHPDVSICIFPDGLDYIKGRRCLSFGMVTTGEWDDG